MELLKKRVRIIYNKARRKALSFQKYKCSKGAGFEHAFRMAELARIKKSDIVLDPFGGAGLSSIMVTNFHPKKVIALDVIYHDNLEPNPRSIGGSRKVWPVAADSLRIPLKHSSIDKVVTSPPYNFKMRDSKIQEEFFEKFLPEISRVLKNRGLVIIKVPAYWSFQYMPFHGFRLVSEEIFNRNNKICVFMLKKRAEKKD